MDMRQKFLLLFAMTVMSEYFILCSHGAPLEESVINKDLNGQELMKMGNLLNKPLLSLLGATFSKTEQNVNKNKDNIDKLTSEICKQTQCAAWTVWSRCSAYTNDTFGARKRSRKCGGNFSICTTTSADTVETDYQVCQGTCKYVLTKNKYCIKLNNFEKKSQKDAQEDCHKNGGYLMNMNSDLKAKDIEEYFTNISFTSDVWIDGKRNLPNGDWKNEYGSENNTFSMWISGEPGRTEDCKVYVINTKKWHGRRCGDRYFYLCELF